MNIDDLKKAIADLLQIVGELENLFPSRRFTLDGKLVGSIGEVLAEHHYELKLLDQKEKLHDAIAHDGRYVQIKSTMKGQLGFGEIPDYYLGVMIRKDGTIEEVFNGPGSVIWEEIKHRKRPKNFVFNVSLTILRKLNNQVPRAQRGAKPRS